MKNLILLLGLLTLTSNIISQNNKCTNLVRQGNFEVSLSGGANVLAPGNTTEWNSTSIGNQSMADLYNATGACETATGNSCKPKCYDTDNSNLQYHSLPPYDGKGYAGFGVAKRLGVDSVTNFEYLFGNLDSNLEADAIYEITLVIALTECRDDQISNLGIKIFNSVLNPITFNANTERINSAANFTFSKMNLFVGEWTEIGPFFYKATGGENKIGIGAFNEAIVPSGDQIAYYNIDNVKVVKATQIASDTVSKCTEGSVTLNDCLPANFSSFFWSGNQTTWAQNTCSINVSDAGMYTSIKHNNKGCPVLTTFKVENYNPSATLVSSQDVSCGATCNGSATIAFTGLPTFNYSLDQIQQSFLVNSSNQTQINNLCAGPHTITFRDGNQCGSHLDFNINELSSADWQLNSTVIDVTCEGGNDGAAKINVSGGTAPYTYIWSDGTTGNERHFLTEGSYTVTVTDANGCTSDYEIVIGIAVACNPDVALDSVALDCQNSILELFNNDGTSFTTDLSCLPDENTTVTSGSFNPNSMVTSPFSELILNNSDGSIVSIPMDMSNFQSNDIYVIGSQYIPGNNGGELVINMNTGSVINVPMDLSDLSNTDDYVTGGSFNFNGGNSQLTLNRNSSSPVVIDMDLSSIQDNYVDNMTISGNTLTLSRTGSLADLSVTLPTSTSGGASDADWFKSTTTNVSNTITDRIYTKGGMDVNIDGTTVVGASSTTAQIRTQPYKSNVIFDDVTIAGTSEIANMGTSRLLWQGGFSYGAFRSGFNDLGAGGTNTVGPGSAGFGRNSIASGAYAVVAGVESNATEYTSIAMGYKANATGNYTVALGAYNLAQGAYSFSAGLSNQAIGQKSTTFGEGNMANGSTSFASGNLTIAGGNNSFTTGHKTKASALNAAAMGKQTLSSGDNSLALGELTQATGMNALSGGISTIAAGKNSFAFGQENKANGINSVAFGLSNVSEGNNATSVGNYNIAKGINSVAGGMKSMAAGPESIALGSKCSASGPQAVAFGSSTVSSGNSSVAFGQNNIASGDFSSAFGQSNKATGPYSSAFGNYTTASGLRATTFGKETVAIGENSTAMGYLSTSEGNLSFAHGQQSKASNIGSIVFGYLSESTGKWAFSSGEKNNAAGQSSAVFGQSNLITANGNFSFATGINNTIDGNSSMAVGGTNHINGAFSAAIGTNINTTGFNNFTFGNNSTNNIPESFEISFNDSKSLHVGKSYVGIGNNDPANKLDITATSGQSGLRLRGLANQASSCQYLTVDANGDVILADISTCSPSSAISTNNDLSATLAAMEERLAAMEEKIIKQQAEIIDLKSKKTTTTSNNILFQNAPNPFSISTEIKFELISGGEVKLQIMNNLGVVIDCLICGYLNAGQHTATWYADDLSNGIYYYTLIQNEEELVKKAVIMN